MSGLQDSIIPHLDAPMQINHIIMSLLPLQWLILAAGRAKERVISCFWSTPGSGSVLRDERRPVSSMLIPLIGVFLSQSPSHCSPRLYPVAFNFIISFCLLEIQGLNDTREAFSQALAPVAQLFDVFCSSPPSHLPLTGPTSHSLHYDTFVDKGSSGKLGALAGPQR